MLKGSREGGERLADERATTTLSPCLHRLAEGGNHLATRYCDLPAERRSAAMRSHIHGVAPGNAHPDVDCDSRKGCSRSSANGWRARREIAGETCCQEPGRPMAAATTASSSIPTTTPMWDENKVSSNPNINHLSTCPQKDHINQLDKILLKKSG